MFPNQKLQANISMAMVCTDGLRKANITYYSTPQNQDKRRLKNKDDELLILATQKVNVKYKSLFNRYIPKRTLRDNLISCRKSSNWVGNHDISCLERTYY